jgi:hypothetical protein
MRRKIPRLPMKASRPKRFSQIRRQTEMRATHGPGSAVSGLLPVHVTASQNVNLPPGSSQTELATHLEGA